jgi:hypothetical protein
MVKWNAFHYSMAYFKSIESCDLFVICILKLGTFKAKLTSIDSKFQEAVCSFWFCFSYFSSIKMYTSSEGFFIKYFSRANFSNCCLLLNKASRSTFTSSIFSV